MTLVTVHNTEVHPDDTPRRYQRVVVALAGRGFNGDGTQTTGRTATDSDVDGLASFDLVPNNDGEWYVWNHPDGSQDKFVVPDSGGPFALETIAILTPPTPLTPDGVTQAQLAAQIAGFVPQANISANAMNHGITCAGVIDDGPAINAALAALAPTAGTVFARPLVFPPNAVCLIETPVTSNAPVGIYGDGRLGLRLKVGPSFPSGQAVLSWVKDSGSPVTLEGKVPHLQLRDFTIDGAERTVAATGIDLGLFDRATFTNVYVASLKGTVLKAQCMRESVILGLRSWMCGDGDAAPVLDLDETGSPVTEGSNLNNFIGCTFALNMGDHMRLRAPSGSVSRVNFFTNCIFHGLNEWVDDYADEYGTAFTVGSGNVPARVVLDNSRSVYFSNCRFHLNGRGQPMFYLTSAAAGSATINSVSIHQCEISYRGGSYTARPVSACDATANTMQLAGGTLTNKHQLQTGSRVQFTGTPPTGITAATNYYVIDVDGTNFKVATTRANALAGAAVDITASVTGASVTQYDTYVTVNASTDVLSAPAHRLSTGARFQVATDGGSIPGGLAAVTDYFVIRVDNDTLKLATTPANARSGAAIDITSAGATVLLNPQDFIAHVEAGTLVWGPGSIVSGVAPPRGYFRVEDTATPAGAMVFSAGGNVWAAGGTSPVAEYASGALAAVKIDMGVTFTRNTASIFLTETDGATLIQALRMTASNVVNVGALTGSVNASFVSNGGLATIVGGSHEGIRVGAGGISFNGVATLASKPAVTGSRGGNAALASALTTLAAMGLITDSSSA